MTDCKIKALQTENEALRLHLKLAVESIRNPVIVPPPKRQEPFNLTREVIPDDLPHPTYAQDEWDDSSDTDVEPSEEYAREVQGQMQDLLKDLGMFKRKLGDDHSRFVQPQAHDGH